MNKPTEGVCTIHQLLSGWDGFPLYKGSEIRTPGGEIIPNVELLSIGPSEGSHHWCVTIRMPFHFGHPISAPTPSILPDQDFTE